jgi:hypothetical protein
MALYVIRLLVISIFAVQGFALPRLKRPYVRQENSEPGDQSWIQKWAAVGDSYAVCTSRLN